MEKRLQLDNAYSGLKQQSLTFRSCKMIGTINKSKYAELLSDILPGVSETEEENERAMEIVNRFMNKGEANLSLEEDKLFALLVRLIEDFEEKAYPEIGESSTPHDTLLFLM